MRDCEQRFAVTFELFRPDSRNPAQVVERLRTYRSNRFEGSVVKHDVRRDAMLASMKVTELQVGSA